MKTIMKTVAVVALAVLTISIANGNPDERAQMMKASWLERLSQDGWQLTQETPSQLIVERRSGMMQTALMHMMSGANGTWAVDHLSVTFLPQSDHLTKFATNWSLNSQNAFGQMTSVPVRNGSDGVVFSMSSVASVLARAATLHGRHNACVLLSRG